MTDAFLSYEVQVSTHAQRKGLGRGILELMKQYGIKYKMRKVVLTCLKGIVHASLWKTSLTRTMYSKRFCDGVLQTSRVRHSIDNESMYLTRQCTDSVFMIFLPANVWKKKMKKMTPIMKFFATILSTRSPSRFA